MDYSIYKYPLLIRDKQTLLLPEKSLILTVKNQNDTLCMWAYVPTSSGIPMQKVEIYIFGTGNPCPPPEEIEDLVFLDTVLMQRVPLVWHVFARLPKGF